MSIDLVMAIHFHQPVGNFDHVIQNICDRCYAPFLSVIKQYPDIMMSFHFSGSLLEWLERNRPEIIETVRDLVKRGQVEIISGGFYEPILPAIPRRDAVKQITMLNEYIKEKFFTEASGAWVAERVWEPAMPSILHEAGIKYVILDDTHLLYSGIKKENIYGYYITEDNGRHVAVFPSDKTLRYSIPFRQPGECMDYMRGVAAVCEAPTFIYADDGEKFGAWPGTNQWVYGEGWLRKFFDELMTCRDWLKTMKVSECLLKKKPLGKVYLPACSYEEMMEWSLPADVEQEYENVVEEIRSEGKEERYKPYIRGGFWRNFLTKYPESGYMSKKMLYVSNRLDSLAKKGKAKDAPKEAARHLYRGQCNCAYWHGVFGGLYLFHLRRAIYSHLIKSETLMDRIVYGKKEFITVDVMDITTDGSKEAVLQNRELALHLDPADGGVLKEIDVKKICHNLSNILTRRKEAYHRRIQKKINNGKAASLADCKSVHDAIEVPDAGIKDHLIYDTYDRHSLIDHFFGEKVGLDMFMHAAYRETGDFIGAEYDLEVKKQVNICVCL